MIFPRAVSNLWGAKATRRDAGFCSITTNLSCTYSNPKSASSMTWNGFGESPCSIGLNPPARLWPRPSAVRRTYKQFLFTGTDMNVSAPVALIILDGWGDAAPGPGNAISLAKTPNLDGLVARFPHTLLRTSGESVGLPDGQMGNSEVGHLNLGAGRIVYQELTRIDTSIRDSDFFSNAA